MQGRWLQVRYATIDEHVPQLQKRDAATIAISEVIPLRLIDDDGGHLCKLEQPMQFDVIHLTSEQVDASRRPLGYVGEESTILELLIRMRLTNSVIRIDEERDGLRYKQVIGGTAASSVLEGGCRQGRREGSSRILHRAPLN